MHDNLADSHFETVQWEGLCWAFMDVLNFGPKFAQLPVISPLHGKSQDRWVQLSLFSVGYVNPYLQAFRLLLSLHNPGSITFDKNAATCAKYVYHIDSGKPPPCAKSVILKLKHPFS